MMRQPNTLLLNRGERRHCRNTYFIILQLLACPSYLAQFRKKFYSGHSLQEKEEFFSCTRQNNNFTATGDALRHRTFAMEKPFSILPLQKVSLVAGNQTSGQL